MGAKTSPQKASSREARNGSGSSALRQRSISSAAPRAARIMHRPCAQAAAISPAATLAVTANVAAGRAIQRKIAVGDQINLRLIGSKRHFLCAEAPKHSESLPEFYTLLTLRRLDNIRLHQAGTSATIDRCAITLRRR